MFHFITFVFSCFLIRVDLEKGLLVVVCPDDGYINMYPLEDFNHFSSLLEYTEGEDSDIVIKGFGFNNTTWAEAEKEHDIARNVEQRIFFLPSITHRQQEEAAIRRLNEFFKQYGLTQEYRISCE